MVGFCRSLLYAAFKVLLLIQLNAMAMVGAPTRDADALAAPDAAAPAAVVAGSAAENQVADGFLSWWVVFTPTYMAAILQIAFHLQKHLETAQSSRSRSTPRRPGFSISLLDLLALNISARLEGVFYIPNASWASVLWPLWIAAAIGAIALFLGLCFAIPLLRRRMPTSQLPFVLPPLVLLVAAYSFGLHGLTALTSRLDGGEAISVSEIMLPITSAVWCLTLLLSVVALSSMCHPAISASDDQQEPPRQNLLSLDPNLLPRLLVQESSTLFRQVSSRTLERYSRLSESGNLEHVGGPSTPPVSGYDLEEGCRLDTTRTIAFTPDGEALSLSERAGAAYSELLGIDQNADASEANVCWVCFEAPADAVLLQCGHGGLCITCAENLWKSRAPCPMCRQPIDVFARLGDAVTVDGKVILTPTLPKPPPEEAEGGKPSS